MLTHKVITRQASVGSIGGYFSDGADDYYAKEGNATQWQGELATELGLSGSVDQETFTNLLKGEISNYGSIRSSTRNDAKDRLGIDLTFAPPKSVSIQALVKGDAEIIKAHDEAVTKVLSEMESLVTTRIKKNGITQQVNTGQFLVAKYRHETNREVEPHLHTHAIVLNFTKTEDGKYRALVNDKLVKNDKMWGARYRAELASKLIELGYSLRMEKDSFEIASYSREQILGFSSRTKSIDEALHSSGLDRSTATADEKQAANYSTRKRKKEQTLTERQEIYHHWQSVSQELGISFSKEDMETANVDEQLKAVSKAEMAKRAVKFAINHYSERQAIMSRNQVAELAMNHGAGYTTPDLIAKEIHRQAEKGGLLLEDTQYTSVNSGQKISLSREDWIKTLVSEGKTRKHAAKQVDMGIAAGRLVQKDDIRFTTQGLFEREQRILKRELSGRNSCEPILSKTEANAFVQNTTLKEQQAATAINILTSRNQMMGIKGSAGVGKSYLYKQLIPELQKNNDVIVLAPYGSQRDLLIKDGLENAKTVASWLHTESRTVNLSSKSIIFIDEAGVLPNRLMDQITKRVEKAGARLVLSGDHDQTKAIENGMPFAMMIKAGMETNVIDKIIRQEKDPEYLKAVELASKGKARESLHQIEKIRTIHEIKDDDSRLEKLSKMYSNINEIERKNTIVLTGTNESRKKINEYIREYLGLTGKGKEHKILSRWDSTKSKRQYAKYYDYGSIIQPEVDYQRAGLKRYEQYAVVGKKGNRLIVKDNSGQQIEFNPKSCSKISVYNLEKQEFSIGDRVKITRNDAKLDVTNGDEFVVKNFDDSYIVLDNGVRQIKMECDKAMHIMPAYCTTVHSAQGMTADRVMYNLDSSSMTTQSDNFYVGISRAKSAIDIFTDDMKSLPDQVAIKSDKTMAHQLDKQSLYKNYEKGDFSL